MGTVTAINSKKVTVETDDGDEESFFLSRIDMEPAPAKKAAKGKKAPPQDEEDDEDDDEPEFSEGDRVQVLDEEDGDEVAVGTVESIDTKKVIVEDEDGDQHTFKFSAGFTLKAAPAKKATAKGKKKDEPEPEEEVDEVYTPEEGDRVKAVDSDDEEVVGTVTAINTKKVTIEDDDGEDHSFKLVDVTLSPAPKKAKAAAKGKKASPPDDDDEDEEEVKPAKKPAGKKKPEPDDDDEDDVKPAKKATTGKKKFNFDDDDGDDIPF